MGKVRDMAKLSMTGGVVATVVDVWGRKRPAPSSRRSEPNTAGARVPIRGSGTGTL